MSEEKRRPSSTKPSSLIYKKLENLEKNSVDLGNDVYFKRGKSQFKVLLYYELHIIDKIDLKNLV
jgi:hypothetical protein